MATDVEWDPTGRYVTTAVTSVHQMENGFNVWTFNGRLLYKHQRERFYQFLWRPRAPSLLSEEKEAEILKNLKSYSKRFDELDESIRNAQDSHLAAEKQEVTDAWNAWLAKKRSRVEATTTSTRLGKSCANDIRTGPRAAPRTSWRRRWRWRRSSPSSRSPSPWCDE